MAEEHRHGQEAKQPDRVQRYRPGEEEGDLEIKDDEQDRYQVVAHIELDTGVFESFETALVSGELCGIRAARAKNKTQRNEEYAEDRGDREKYQDR